VFAAGPKPGRCHEGVAYAVSKLHHEHWMLAIPRNIDPKTVRRSISGAFGIQAVARDAGLVKLSVGSRLLAADPSEVCGKARWERGS
jgi:hypothetical protein